MSAGEGMAGADLQVLLELRRSPVVCKGETDYDSFGGEAGLAYDVAEGAYDGTSRYRRRADSTIWSTKHKRTWCRPENWRGRRDSNPQRPDRQSGTLTN